MTREEIFKVCNYDLAKAKEADQWLNPEPVQIQQPVVNTPVVGCGGVDLPDVCLKLKDGSYVTDPADLKKKIKLNQVDYIVVRNLAGRNIGIVPKYKQCQLLADGKEDDWKAKGIDREVDALFVTPEQAQEMTQSLFDLDSEAAKFVRSVRENAFIPDLCTLIAIEHLVDQINAFAARIDGADLLDGKTNAWSVVRYDAYSAWYFYGRGGYVSGYGLCYSYLAVPCVLL